MNEKVKKLNDPDKCETFARNVEERGHPELAQQARKRATELRAEKNAERYGVKTQAEKEALQAIYAYEEVLSKKNGKRTRANRTWPMVERHGIIETIERAVNRTHEPQGYSLLVEMGLQELAFEAVVLRYQHLFSESTVRISEERMVQYI